MLAMVVGEEGRLGGGAQRASRWPAVTAARRLEEGALAVLAAQAGGLERMEQGEDRPDQGTEATEGQPSGVLVEESQAGGHEGAQAAGRPSKMNPPAQADVSGVAGMPTGHPDRLGHLTSRGNPKVN